MRTSGLVPRPESIDDWIQESLELTGTEVYTPAIREYVKSREYQGAFGKISLPKEYFGRAADVCRVRAVQAGGRLGKLLQPAE